MGKLPKGWLDYTPLGQRMEGTRFISFKVPLMNMSLHEVAENNRLDGPMLLERVPNLGMIIDLTDTSRYYNPNYFMARGLHYRKLSVPGHVLPHPKLHKQFASIVDTYLLENGGNDNLIGVHCTHGCNRTGLMICTYLVSKGIFDANEAIATFQKFRGHEIHRDNYTDAIRRTRRDGSDAANSPHTQTTPALSWRNGAKHDAPPEAPPAAAQNWPNSMAPSGAAVTAMFGTPRDITPQSWRDRQAAAAAAAAKSALSTPPTPADWSAVPPPNWLDRPAGDGETAAVAAGHHDPLVLRWQQNTGNGVLAQLNVRPQNLIPDGHGGYYIRVQSDGPVPDGEMGTAANSSQHFLQHPPPPRFVPATGLFKSGSTPYTAMSNSNRSNSYSRSNSRGRKQDERSPTSGIVDSGRSKFAQ